MKITIPKIAGREQLRAIHTVGCVDWPAEFPYAPEVRFGIGHTGSEILLRFEVAEQAVLARATADNGAVWEDSCVEFFINFDETGYYNFEFNCIGTKLLGFRKEREKFTHAPAEVMRSIETFPSLGRQAVELREGDVRWTLEAVIPVTAFFRHRFADLAGMSTRANFYKCGDALPTPHFLSWAPIDNPTPNFHLEHFFGEVDFE
jgi:hypothetical protein